MLDFFSTWFYSLLSSGICHWFFPHFGIFSSWLLCIGKTKNRMMCGGSNSQAGEDVPVRRSARQAGHSPEPYQPPLPSPPQPPSTEQILRMFEERRSNDLLEILKSVQVMVGQNGNQNGHHSKLSDFQRTKPPSFSHATDPLDADDWLRTIERKLEIACTDDGDKVPFATQIGRAHV